MQVNGGQKLPYEKSNFGENVSNHCNQWGLLFCGCVKVRKAIELPFGVVSGVGQALMYYMGVHIPKEREGFLGGGISSINLNGDFEFIRNRNAFDSCVKS